MNPTSLLRDLIVLSRSPCQRSKTTDPAAGCERLGRRGAAPVDGMGDLCPGCWARRFARERIAEVRKAVAAAKDRPPSPPPQSVAPWPPPAILRLIIDCLVSVRDVPLLLRIQLKAAAVEAGLSQAPRREESADIPPPP